MVISSWVTDAGTRKSMQGNRSRDTSPEVEIRKALHAMGLRLRVQYRPIPGLRHAADLAFTRYKLLVYMGGCFWHKCPVHYREPKSNAE
ncbi:very short patch repair endonuclease [Cryobacterium sp. M96]|uniref:very short patch repair endonuclease n=1 Tax=Cryobacterium sp. M96 TaxID=2048295 RepID=UPI002101756D|nr:very short patch repair endonuclease [Cryobacterium sp. M96]